MRVQGADTKLGGILIGSSFRDGSFKLVIGCGFNVSNAHPTVCLDQVIARHNLAHSTDLPPLRMESVLAGALSLFADDYSKFAQRGFRPFFERYYRRWIHSGQTVEVVGADEVKRKVVIAGVTDDGYLHGQAIESGERVELEPDGNTFDMMRGLIQRKL
eukprot:COSAG04_NODE_5816_length_1485_cov_5.257576_2_plen_159_part_00